MKYAYPVLLFFAACCIMGFECNKSPEDSTVYTGKLEIKGICMNYTLSVVSPAIDTSLVMESWTDPTTNTSYENAFALSNLCNFPDSIQAGETFKFIITPSEQTLCMVCLAYYPTPLNAFISVW